MRYTTILFDLDGTLLDTLDDLTDAVNRTMRRFSLPERSRAEVRRFVGNGSRRLIELAAGADHPQLEEILAVYAADYDQNCLVKTAPYPGIMDAMRTLKAQGRRIGIISNKPDSAVNALADALFPGLTDIAVGDRPGARRKPAPDSVNEVLGRRARGHGGARRKARGDGIHRRLGRGRAHGAGRRGALCERDLGLSRPGRARRRRGGDLCRRLHGAAACAGGMRSSW